MTRDLRDLLIACLCWILALAGIGTAAHAWPGDPLAAGICGIVAEPHPEGSAAAPACMDCLPAVTEVPVLAAPARRSAATDIEAAPPAVPAAPLAAVATPPIRAPPGRSV